MNDSDLARLLRGIARRHISINHQENQVLKEAAQRLAQLAAPARLMTYEEISKLPEGAIVWEEWQGLPEEYRYSDCDIAPVARIGGGLAGNGITTIIHPSMLTPSEDGASRWWTARPTKQQREETPWQTCKAGLCQTAQTV